MWIGQDSSIVIPTTPYPRLNPKTVHNDIVDLRLFFKWLIPDNDFFDGVKSKAPKNHLPVKELILPEDVKQLVAATNTQRDRALLMLLWDSAARVSEVLDLNIGDIQLDKYGAICIVEGKTGMRRLRLIESVPKTTSQKLWKPESTRCYSKLKFNLI